MASGRQNQLLVVAILNGIMLYYIGNTEFLYQMFMTFCVEFYILNIHGIDILFIK